MERENLIKAQQDAELASLVRGSVLSSLRTELRDLQRIGSSPTYIASVNEEVRFHRAGLSVAEIKKFLLWLEDKG